MMSYYRKVKVETDDVIIYRVSSNVLYMKREKSYKVKVDLNTK